MTTTKVTIVTTTEVTTTETRKIDNRSLSQIALDIKKDWGVVDKKAEQYLNVMRTLKSIDDKHGFDSGKLIVVQFLFNAQSWRGEVAKATKIELRKRCGL